MHLSWSLYTDLYQISMAQGYYFDNIDEEASFYMFFRDYPFNGGYAVAAGMAQLAEMIDGYSFNKGDIEYLKGIDAPGGGRLFDERFLEYLSEMELTINIDSVKEGEVVFPFEPILRVTGPIMQCQLVETMLLNCVNFQTLIATEAARICQITKDAPVAEFGLRRAQGLGGLWASRAAYIGGCASTSNVLAGKMFDIPVSGTHAHSWVMAFDDELEAFREYARLFPNNCTLLVDSYDVKTGIENAIIVGLEMKERGERLSAIRIDSGDLAWLAKMARKMLDEAGLQDVGIVLSNDLDEHTIQSIIDEGAPVDAWGIGTKLASAYNQPTLGGVYKLSAIKKKESDTWIDRLKVSESATKTTIPGLLDVRRYFSDDSKIAGDMIFDVNSQIDPEERIVDPMDPLRQKNLKGKRYETLLHPIVKCGKSVLGNKDRSAQAAKERACNSLKRLDSSQLRLLNPHTYPVGLEYNLNDRRIQLVSDLRKLS